MQEPTETTPRLVRRILETNDYEDAPSYQWENCLFFHFLRESFKGTLLCNSYEFTQHGAELVSSQTHYGDAFISSLIDLNKTLLLPIQEIPKEHQLSNWDESDNLLIIPVCIFTSPIGLMLMPYKHTDEIDLVLNQNLNILAEIAKECMIVDVLGTLISINLKQYQGESDLAKAFIKVVAEWVFPKKYELFLEEKSIAKDQFETICKGKGYTLTLKLQTNHKTFLAKLDLPDFSYPNSNDYHQLEIVKLQKIKYLNQLEMIFLNVLDSWSNLRLSDLSIINRLESVIDQYQYQLGQMSQELREIKQYLSSSSSTLASKTNEDKFCFYRVQNNWIILFDGKTIRPEINSVQGMEAIRILLAFENFHLPPLELDSILRESGFTYSTSKSLSQEGDLQLDIVRERDLLEDLESNKKLEKEVLNASVKDQVFYWQYRFQITNALLSHSLKKKYYIDRKRAKLELDKLVFLHGVDETFSDITSSIIRPSRKSGNEKNRKDSIRKAINKVLKSLEPFPKIHGYLDKTIIKTNRSNRYPFVYDPNLYVGEKYKNIFWKT